MVGAPPQGSPTGIVSGSPGDNFNPQLAFPVQAIGYVFDGTNWQRWITASNASDVSNLTAGIPVGNYGHNGTNFQRWQSNVDGQVFASASVATGTTNSSDITIRNHRGVNLIVDITSVGAAGTLQLVVQVKDSVSGKYATAASFSVDTAVSTNNKQVVPGVVAVVAINGFESFSRALGRIIRVQAVVAGNSVTFSVGYTSLV